MTIVGLIDVGATMFEAAGGLAMIGGAILALLVGILRDHRAGGAVLIRQFRQRLGKAIIVGLEFLVAADILRTISEPPSLPQVASLGAIVLIRTFLSFTLEVELDGRWPWQPRPEKITPEG